jgi:DNA-binding GntR family transcriptional regulator
MADGRFDEAAGPGGHAGAIEVAGIEEDGRLLSVRIADEIRRAVLDGEMRPGTRVGQEWLAAKFGASRIPVREALRQLQSEGLVVLAPNRGGWIADVTSQESIEVYKIREVLEPLAISESVPWLTDEDIASLEATMRRLEQVGSVQEYIPLDREFHLKTYSRAPMPHLREMIERYWNSTQHFRRWFVKDSLAKDGLPFSDPQHLMLMEAIRARDADAASSLVRLHIRRTRLLIETMVNAATPVPAPPARVRIRRETPQPQTSHEPPTAPRAPRA